jgi:hypothetical protein
MPYLLMELTKILAGPECSENRPPLLPFMVCVPNMQPL